MTDTIKKYSISDLHKGMKVFKEQLSDIYDVWIILYRPKESDMEEDGIIGFVGKETNEESDALYTDDNIITPIYNDSIDLEDSAQKIQEVYDYDWTEDII